MAWTTSGGYVANIIDVMDATQLTFDYSISTHKQALYTNSLTPDFSANTAYSSTNEVTGTGYTAGGSTIATLGGSPTVAESPTGTIRYDMTDSTWSTVTISTGPRGLNQYADAVSGDPLMFGINFGADYPVSGGNLVIQWASGGVMTRDVIP